MESKPVGSLYGYKVLVKGEYDDPYSLHKWKTPGGYLETDDPFAAFNARTQFSLDSIVTLVAYLGALRLKDFEHFSAEIQKAGYEPNLTFLPFLMRRLVSRAIAERDLPDSFAEPITAFWLLKAEQVLMDIAAVADRATYSDQEKERWSRHSMAMRAMQIQFHDQLGADYYKRELWINRQTVEEALKRGLDIERHYADTFGLSVSELSALSFGAYTTAAGTPGATFHPATWNRLGVTSISADRIEAFFRLCSQDYAGFQALAKAPSVSPQGYEPYALSPLIRYPLVTRSDGLAVAPLPRDLLERPTRAFRIDALQALETQGANVGTFNQVQGKAYEDFVYRSLASSAGCGEVMKGTEALPADGKNCDFVCIEEGAATLVEVKATWIGVIADITKDVDRLRDEFAKPGSVVDGLIQLNESAKAIREGRTKIKKNALLNAVLVLRGEQVFLNSPLMLALLEQLFLKRSDNPQMRVKFHLMNDIGLSATVRLLLDGGSLARLLYDKRRHKTERHEDFHHVARKRNPNLPPHPLDHLGNLAVDEITSQYYPRAK